MTKRMLAQPDRYRLHKLLEEHLTPRGEDGCVTYKNDMTDAKIAALLGAHVSSNSVTNTRQQVFGHLRKPPRNDLEARVARLEEEVALLAKTLFPG